MTRLGYLLAVVLSACGSAPAVSEQRLNQRADVPPQLAVGDAHVCVLVAGVAWCLGEDTYGQRGAAGPARTPLPVENLTERLVSIGADDTSTCACSEAGQVWCWGRHSDLPPGRVVPPGPLSAVPLPLSNAVSVHTGGCSLGRDGSIWCWPGYESTQTLAGFVPVGYSRPSPPASREAPFDPTWGLAPPVQIPLPRPAVELARGAFHACAVLDDGATLCWGQNAWGQLTDGPLDGTFIRAAVPRLHGIAAGFSASCGIDEDGHVVCWGMLRNPIEPACLELVRRGIGSAHPGDLRILPSICRPPPAVVSGIEDARLVRVDGWGCAIDGAGDLYCWDSVHPAAVRVASDIVDVDLDVSAGCALNRSGLVSCWGLRAEGVSWARDPPGVPVAQIDGDTLRAIAQ